MATTIVTSVPATLPYLGNEDGKRAPRPDLGLEDGDHYFEIIDGIRVEKPPMGLFAAVLATYLATMINLYALPRRLGLAIVEAPHHLAEGMSRRPDVSYVSLNRIPPHALLAEDPPEFEGSPNLAIEVISPSNTNKETERKLLLYFSSGTQAVWVVHPTVQRIYVYDSPSICKILGIKDELDGGTVIPGFSMKLSELFHVPNLPA